MHPHNHKPKLFEGLKAKDLKYFVSNTFTIDRYKSKMGEDKDIVVLGFDVNAKHPAIDLMEFIEKGYNFVLDSDMSSGEEHDGKYRVFVELERTYNLPNQLQSLLNGMSQLTDNYDWHFKYQKSKAIIPFSREKIVEQIPLNSDDYEKKLLEMKNTAVNKFFNQGALDGVFLDENNVLTFKKPYFGDLKMKLIDFGKYNQLEKQLSGPINLDENSQSQIYFLQKYLGNYEINKIGNQFLIRNDKFAIVAEKESW